MNIFIMPIEPLETRYTAQWHTHLPNLLIDKSTLYNRKDVKVYSISGHETSGNPTEGAFLDFAATNIFKSTQTASLAEYFQDGTVKDGDHIIFTDAWHPGIIQVKYMKDLLGIDVKIHGLWHAGSYDPQDFLGRLIKDKSWSYNFERSIYYSLDYNWFATQFHIDMFEQTLFGRKIPNKPGWQPVCQTGWPMEYMPELLSSYSQEKENIILFPHRLAPEKQPEIFYDLANELPEYKFVVCQEQKLTKNEYHTLLGKAKMVFSANLQETLGISAYEGALLGAMPLVPNNLSYVEMYNDTWKYPFEWTNGNSGYQQHKEELKSRIKEMMDNYDSYRPDVFTLADMLSNTFFNSSNLIGVLYDN